MPVRPSCPTPDMNNKEMSMTEERQHEIQASLFRILGQADDIPSSPPSKSTSSFSKDPIFFLIFGVLPANEVRDFFYDRCLY